MENHEIEAAIQTKGLTAPRVTMDHILAAIDCEEYHRVQGTTVTICTLRLKNGYVVIGSSACVSEENYDQQLGESIAKDKAIDQCWALFVVPCFKLLIEACSLFSLAPQHVEGRQTSAPAGASQRAV